MKVGSRTAAATFLPGLPCFDPPFHFLLAPLALLNIAACIRHYHHDPTHWNAWLIVMSFTLVVLLIKMRRYALYVQDRVIRGEERLRIAELGGIAMRDRFDQLDPLQVVALRFASDAEMVPLMQRALDEKLTPKQIKQSIQNWRPDYHRA